MENNLKSIIDIKINQTKEALENNNMKTIVCENKQEAKDYIASLLKDNKIVALGGSATLSSLDVVDMCRTSNVQFIDRYEEGLSQEESMERLRQGLLSDLFITSSNAVSKDGCLYNIDGTGNRVSAMIFGPKQVLVVVGYNKIFEDESSAIEHIKKIAAPANATRLNRKTPCTVTGQCENCQSKERICCSYVKLAWQRLERITVVIVKEELGY